MAVATILEVDGANSTAMNADGSELYVASDLGLQAYQRDAATGELRYLQNVAGVEEDAALLWDAASNSLLVAACGSWQRFAPAAAGGGLEPASPLAGDGICPSRAVFVDPSGSFIYFVRADEQRIDAIRLNAERTSFELARHDANRRPASRNDQQQRCIRLRWGTGLGTR